MNYTQKHGMSNTPEYKAWLGMKKRCYYLKHVAYKQYGGRGIKVCDRWRNDFEAFYADIGPRPEGMSLDRIDNDGDYEPSNCKWSTRYEQQHNRRRTKAYRYPGTNKYIGVYKRTDRYVVVFRPESHTNQIYISSFTDELDAAYVRDQIILQLHNDERSELNVLEWSDK